MLNKCNVINIIFLIFIFFGVAACDDKSKNISDQSNSQPQAYASPSKQMREIISFPEGQQLKCKYDTIVPADNNYKADYSSLKQINITVVYLRKNNVLNVVSTDGGTDRLEQNADFEKSESEVINPSRVVHGTSFRNSNAIASFVINEENSVKEPLMVMLVTSYINGLFNNSYGKCSVIN